MKEGKRQSCLWTVMEQKVEDRTSDVSKPTSRAWRPNQSGRCYLKLCVMSTVTVFTTACPAT